MSNRLPAARAFIREQKLNEMLPAYLHGKSFASLDRRRETVAKLSTAAEVDARRRYVRQKMIESLGEFPERTPLNAPDPATFYAGEAKEAIVFDQPGVVVLGCNIHDWMAAYVVVLATPWFAQSGADGALLPGHAHGL